jgi:N-alpha-acetyltransferase 30
MSSSEFDLVSPSLDKSTDIIYANYKDESYLPALQTLVAKDLSEPYSVYTYRYFLHKWPELCICVFDVVSNVMIGCIVCKSEFVNDCMQGYIAMLTVSDSHRKRGIGSKLAQEGIRRMKEAGCSEIVLETEVSNLGALALYNKLGFVREERLARYYLNNGDAFRLKYYIDDSEKNISYAV